MHVSDGMIRTAMRAEVERVGPPPDLWDRVRQGLHNKGKGSPLRPALAAGLVAVVAVATVFAIPASRVRAVALIRATVVFVGEISGVNYKVVEGGVIVKPPPAPAGKATEISKGSNTAVVSGKVVQPRLFTGPPGEFPAEARAAIQAPFRIPKWLPPDLRVVVHVYDHWLHVRLGERIFLDQLKPADSEMNILGGDNKLAAKKVRLAGLEALEVRSGERVSYYFSVGGVSVTAHGPAADADAIRRLAESVAG